MQQLPPEITAQLDMPEGSLKVGYTFPAPLSEAPDERLTLIAGVSPSSALVRIDLDESLHIHFVRQGGATADVGVDLSPLLGAQRFYFWGTWSPLAMQINVIDRDSGKMVTSDPE